MLRKKIINNNEYCDLISRLINFISLYLFILFNSTMSKFCGDMSIPDKVKILGSPKTYPSAEASVASFKLSYCCF